MKKAKWLCLLFVCLLLLPACGGKGEGGGKGQPPALPAEFEADMTAVISEQTIKAHIVRHALLSCEIRVTEPKMFNGVTIIWNGDTYRVEYQSMAFDVDLSQFPQSALGAAVVNSIESLARLESLEITEKPGWPFLLLLHIILFPFPDSHNNAPDSSSTTFLNPVILQPPLC